MAGGEEEAIGHWSLVTNNHLLVRGHCVTLDHGLAALEENQLQVQIALNATHHVVADDIAVAKVEQRLTLAADHRRADAAILGGPSIVERAGIV